MREQKAVSYTHLESSAENNVGFMTLLFFHFSPVCLISKFGNRRSGRMVPLTAGEAAAVLGFDSRPCSGTGTSQHFALMSSILLSFSAIWVCKAL